MQWGRQFPLDWVWKFLCTSLSVDRAVRRIPPSPVPSHKHAYPLPSKYYLCPQHSGIVNGPWREYIFLSLTGLYESFGSRRSCHQFLENIQKFVFCFLFFSPMSFFYGDIRLLGLPVFFFYLLKNILPFFIFSVLSSFFCVRSPPLFFGWSFKTSYIVLCFSYEVISDGCPEIVPSQKSLCLVCANFMTPQLLHHHHQCLHATMFFPDDNGLNF